MKNLAQTVIEADHFYTIAAHTGNVIQAVEGGKDGATVRLGKYEHKPEQEWSFVREGDGVYRIRNRATGKLLDLTMTGTANGTWLHLWEDVGGTSQMWKVEHTPEGTVRLRSSWAGGKCVDTVGMGAEVGAVLQIWQEVPGADQLWTIAEVKDRAKRAVKKEEVAAPVVEADPAVTTSAPAEEKTPTAKKPAARKPRAKKTVEAPAAKAEEPVEKAAEPTKVEEPVKKTTTRKPRAKKAVSEPVVEAKAESAAEEKPKAKRAPRKKTVKETV